MGNSFRRHPAHPPPIRRHNVPIILHVTVSTVCKTVRLDEGKVHSAMADAWRSAIHWRTGNYTIMPDHVHFFCSPGIPDFPPVRRWVGYWKRMVGENEPTLKGVFLEDCWDTQMRDRAHYAEKLSYVLRNPERKGLVANGEEWPFQGKVFDLVWQ